MYLNNEQIAEMSERVLIVMDVTPISRQRKIEVATEHAQDEWGINPNKRAVLLAVKLADAAWNESVIWVKQQLGAAQ